MDKNDVLVKLPSGWKSNRTGKSVGFVVRFSIFVNPTKVRQRSFVKVRKLVSNGQSSSKLENCWKSKPENPAKREWEKDSKVQIDRCELAWWVLKAIWCETGIPHEVLDTTKAHFEHGISDKCANQLRFSYRISVLKASSDTQLWSGCLKQNCVSFYQFENCVTLLFSQNLVFLLITICS